MQTHSLVNIKKTPPIWAQVITRAGRILCGSLCEQALQVPSVIMYQKDNIIIVQELYLEQGINAHD